MKQQPARMRGLLLICREYKKASAGKSCGDAGTELFPLRVQISDALRSVRSNAEALSA